MKQTFNVLKKINKILMRHEFQKQSTYPDNLKVTRDHKLKIDDRIIPGVEVLLDKALLLDESAACCGVVDFFRDRPDGFPCRMKYKENS